MGGSVLPFHTFPAPHLGFLKRPRPHPDLEEGQSRGAPISSTTASKESTSEDEAGGGCTTKTICGKTGVAGP